MNSLYMINFLYSKTFVSRIRGYSYAKIVSYDKFITFSFNNLSIRGGHNAPFSKSKYVGK